MKVSPHTRLAVFGGADGLTVVIGLIAGLVVSRQSAGAVWHAALAGGLAEFVGMAAGQYLSDEDAGLRVALTCGAAALAACTLPAVPYAVSGGFPALLTALMLVGVAATAISWLRPEKGVLAAVQTFGILVAAALLCAAVALI